MLADLHANWHALEAVLADAGGRYDTIVCCGDVVGYNAQPARVLDWTRQNCATVIRGNHDKVVGGIEDLEWFNDIAQVAARWTVRQLDPERIRYLRDLQKGPVKLAHFHVCHGSPQDEDEYVSTIREAAPCFAHFELPLAFFGHTHLQGGFFLRHGRVGRIPAVKRKERESVLQLETETAYYVNPGSVGQPRDGDARAAYAVYDSDGGTVTLRRVEYPIEKTAAEIQSAGLPGVLGLRLFQGM